MNKILPAALGLLLLAGTDASAKITVKLPANSGMDSVSYYYAPVQKLATAKKRADRGLVSGAAAVKDNVAEIPMDSDPGGARYGINFSDRSYIDLYALPGEEIVAEVTSVSPLDYKLSGTPLIDTMNEMAAIEESFEAKQKALSADGAEPSREAMMALYGEYTQAVKDYIEENITNPDVVFAVMSLDGEDYVSAFDRLSERAKTSFLYPLAESRYAGTKESLEKERMQQELANGTHPAPGFTLKDLEGKDVSLSQFKGKWVILDFWGSWCIWCIKGFPELKEAYAKYKDRLEVIGIDCRETEDAWKKGVAKYELPWVNVYCPEGNPLFKEYGIQGFPTKAIVGPDGILRNLTVGHDPDFFVKLDELMAEPAK